MKAHRALSVALLFASSFASAIAAAQPLPPPQPPPGGQPVADPPVAQPAPDMAPAQPLPQAPPPQWVPVPAAPLLQGPVPEYGQAPVVVMPPGYLEQPGQWPRRLAVQEKGDLPPLGYHTSKESRRALWATGTGIFVAGHAITGIVAGGMLSSGGEAHDALLYIPVLGPIIWSPVESPLDTTDGRGLFAGMSLVTAAQGVGLALMISGFVFKQPVFYRNDVDAKLEEPAIQPTFGFGPGGLQGGFAF